MGRARGEAKAAGPGSSWARGRSACGPCACPAWRGTLTWPTQPERTFAHELAGRVRVIAGLDQPPILLHSEKWPDCAGSDRSCAGCAQRLGCGDAGRAGGGLGPASATRSPPPSEIRLRYVDALDGVPNETRQPFADGSTDFERILPGPDRMYPDTDSPPTRVTRERVERLRAGAARRRPGSARSATPRPACRRPRGHYLIRRGGAALVDRVVGARPAPTCASRASSSASGSRACVGAGVHRRRASPPSAGWSCSGPSPRGRCCGEAAARLVRLLAREPRRQRGRALLAREGLDPSRRAGASELAAGLRRARPRPTTTTRAAPAAALAR